MDADLFDSWFRLADKDRDNRISGVEAVEFFQRANLPQETLFKIWSLVAGDNAFLTKPQFYSTLRLVSLAQQSGGVMPEGAARSTLIGVGPPLPAPTLAGLQQPQQLPQLISQPQPGSASVGAAKPPQAGGAFPPMQPSQAQQYGSIFSQMDNDRDGFVQGSDCIQAFQRWGLPKATLKDVWQVVAGNDGRLSQQQFVQCLYLMDQAKRGQAPPAKLPEGPFPPMAATPQISPGGGGVPGGRREGPTGFSIADTQRAEYDVFSNELPIPEMPPKRAWQAPASAPSADSAVPLPGESALSQQPPAQRQRLEGMAKDGREAEQELSKAQSETQIAKEREAAFQLALQELTLFKSRTSAALLQVQERAAQATSQADAMQQQYEAAWAGAEDTHRTGRRLLDALTKAKGRRAEMTTKLEELERDIAHLGQHSEEQVDAEEAAANRLSEEVAAAEAKKASLELRVQVVSSEREKLEQQLATLQGGVAEAEEQLAEQQEAIASIREQAASVDIPEEAQLLGAGGKDSDEPPGPRILQWSDFVTAGAADWEDFEDEGFTVVDALPNEERYEANPGASARSRISPAPASPSTQAPARDSNGDEDLEEEPAEDADAELADTAKSGELSGTGPKALPSGGAFIGGAYAV
ncbi:hypothetical protein WJX73_000496 [Symbiochloris irregularis]|uniref:Uncharacterized protein n=1 Tax=Symbiochloris irregularis TaxID=706552 RepID=A0AAW1NLY9_9CHLO